MGKLMDPGEEGASDAAKANATGGDHIVILEGGKKRLRVAAGGSEAEDEQEPVRTEGEVSAADARSPQETMEAVLLKLPAPERASMGINDLHAVRFSDIVVDLDLIFDLSAGGLTGE